MQRLAAPTILVGSRFMRKGIFGSLLYAVNLLCVSWRTPLVDVLRSQALAALPAPTFPKEARFTLAVAKHRINLSILLEGRRDVCGVL